jgi:hypothetical protein
MESTVSNHDIPSLTQILGMLKLVEMTAATAGYRTSLQPFRDSITCLNFGRESLEPCDRCWLMKFVPPGYNQQVLPCHQIPLNVEGETVASLGRTGDRERLREAILGWLRSNITRMKQEIIKESGEIAAPRTS